MLFGIEVDKGLQRLTVRVMGIVDKSDLTFRNRSGERQLDQRTVCEFFFDETADHTCNTDTDLGEVDEQIHV